MKALLVDGEIRVVKTKEDIQKEFLPTIEQLKNDYLEAVILEKSDEEVQKAKEAYKKAINSRDRQIAESEEIINKYGVNQVI